MGTRTQLLYQIVFGSKYCKPFMDKRNQKLLFNYMAGFSHNKKSIPYIIGGYKNHVHLIVSVHPSISLSEFVGQIKTASHQMMKKNPHLFENFVSWQGGYGGFTYSFESKDNLIRYVENQEEHHRKISFKEELIKFYEEFEIEYDIKYLFI